MTVVMRVFQSTLPAGEATPDCRKVYKRYRISIHASRGGSDEPGLIPQFFNHISIHASRGGSDNRNRRTFMFDKDISIHASRGGSDGIPSGMPPNIPLFQSTLPAGEATRRKPEP